MSGKPAHVAHHSPPALYPTEVLNSGIVSSNTNHFKSTGMSELEATKTAIKVARGHNPNSHRNLGKYLHPKKER